MPTRGIERWLTQRLSARLGATPGAAGRGVRQRRLPVPGDAREPGAGPGASAPIPTPIPGCPQRAVWPLMEVVAGALRRPVARAARPAHPQLGDRGGVQALRQHPPRGRPLRPLRACTDPRCCSAGPPVPRRRARPPGRSSCGACCATASGSRARPSGCSTPVGDCGRSRQLLDLPPRLSLFGLTRLPASYLDVLEPLAEGRDVHLFLLHPSPALWERLAGRGRAGVAPRCRGRRTRRRPRRATRCCRRGAATPGRCSSCWAAAVPHGEEAPPAPDRRGRGRSCSGSKTTSAPTGLPSASGAGGDDDSRPVLAADDDSIRVHACHGRGRQVEVLRDAILHLLEDDPTLEPRDIIVMCPDIENFAPLIQATFGGHDLHGDSHGQTAHARDPPGRPLAPPDQPGHGRAGRGARAGDGADHRDRGARPGRSRAGAPAVPLQRRRPLPARGVGQRGVRPVGLRRGPPGLVPAGGHRGQHLAGGSGPDPARRGHGRGAAALFGGALPLDDVDSGDIDLAGRLAEFVDRLRGALDDLRRPPHGRRLGRDAGDASPTR